MTLQTINASFLKGGAGLTDGTLANAVEQILGLTSAVVVGAAANTTMTLAAIRPEDTIKTAIYQASGTGPFIDAKSTITINSVKATGTITISDLPVANDTVTVNGTVFTFKAVATDPTHIEISTDDSDGYTAMALSLKNAINAYQTRLQDNGAGFAYPVLVATAAAGVVTLTATVEGVGNGATVTDTGTTITVVSTDPGAVTATFASAGNTDALTVNGVAFTIKTTPVNLDVDMGVKASNTLQAAEMVRAINCYQRKYGTLNVVASSDGAVVTISPRTTRTGNSITLTESATGVAVSGSGYLTGGTATGGIKSSLNLTSQSLYVEYYNHNA